MNNHMLSVLTLSLLENLNQRLLRIEQYFDDLESEDDSILFTSEDEENDLVDESAEEEEEEEESDDTWD